MAGLIRVMVVDDHPATAEGLAALLAAAEGIEVVGAVISVAEARALVQSSQPDVVLCDIDLGGGARGFELLDESQEVRSTPSVVMFSAYDYPAFRARAVQRGAAGFVSKTAPIADILKAIRIAAGGGTSFTASDLRAARSAVRSPSDRELEVISLVVSGQSNDEIAAALAIGPKTVESHLRRMFGRYSVYNRTALAMLAIQQGWIERDS